MVILDQQYYLFQKKLLILVQVNTSTDGTSATTFT